MTTLTKQQISELEAKLRAEETDVREQLSHIGENLDFGDEIDHLEEETDESEELANRTGVKKSLEHRLERIITALEKVGKGTYGICEKCKGPIPLVLLSIDPESELCKACKSHE